MQALLKRPVWPREEYMRSGWAKSADLETRKGGDDAARWKDPEGLPRARAWSCNAGCAGFLCGRGGGSDGAGQPLLQPGEHLRISGRVFERLQPHAAGGDGESQAAQYWRDLQSQAISESRCELAVQRGDLAGGSRERPGAA